MMRVSVINGPNLNLLGKRQPEIYGSDTLDILETKIRSWAQKSNIEVGIFQSNDESELVDAIQEAANFDGAVLNPGGFTHTSVSIADAVASIDVPVVEVHLSDIHRREDFRRRSLIEPVAVRQISGRGSTGYRDALRHLKIRLESGFELERYGPHPRNVADIRRADPEKAQIILVHGGYWSTAWDRDQMDAISADLHGRGYTTINISYRLDPPWPGSGHDVELAMSRFANDSAQVVMGHSAGGYLSLWANRRSNPALCVALAPVTDLGLVDDVPATRSMTAAGAPERVDASSNCLVFYGAEDAEVPTLHSERMSDQNVVEGLPGVGHFDLINPQRDHWPQIVSAMEARLG